MITEERSRAVGTAYAAGYEAGHDDGIHEAGNRPEGHAEQYPRTATLLATAAQGALSAQVRILNAKLGDAEERAAAAEARLAEAVSQLAKLTEYAARPVETGEWTEYATEIDTDGEPPLIVAGMVSAQYRRIAPGGIQVAFSWLPSLEHDRRGTGTRYTITLPSTFAPADADPAFAPTANGLSDAS